MKWIGKRLGYRVIGGLGTIVLGALAAAQAQRQDASFETPPSLETPSWAEASPMPIQSQPQSFASVEANGRLDGAVPANEQIQDHTGSPNHTGNIVQPAGGAWQLPGPADVAAVSYTSTTSQPNQPNNPSDSFSDVTGTTQQIDSQQSSGPQLALKDLPPNEVLGGEVIASGSAVLDSLDEQYVVDPSDANVNPVIQAAVMSEPHDTPTIQMVADTSNNPISAPPSMPMPAMQMPPMSSPIDQSPGEATNTSMSDASAYPTSASNPLRGESTMSSMDAPAFGMPTNDLPTGNATMMPPPAALMNEPAPVTTQPNPLGLQATQSDMPVLPLGSPPMMSTQENVSASTMPTLNAMSGQNPTATQAALPPLPNGTYSEQANHQPYAAGAPSGQPNLSAQTSSYPLSTPPQPSSIPHGNPQSGNLPGRLAGHARGSNMTAPMMSDYDQAMTAPGDRRLEGSQTPSVAIVKQGPEEVKVGTPATFVIQVRNVGTVEAINVQVQDHIPSGMQLIDAKPEPLMQANQLLWQLGAMPAGDERSITMQLVPQTEGELGSVATVSFGAAASVRTRSTRPELKIVQRVRQDVLIGQQLEIDLEVSNIGTGAATGVILQVDVPEGLEHPRGRQLDNALGTLGPGETRHEILRLRAASPGLVRNTVRLVAEDAETVADSVDVQVTAPQLLVALSGPNRRFLERQATYTVNLENRGSAAATNLEMIAMLDRGFTFVSTENMGAYDPNRHAVVWSLANLPAGEAASVPLTLLPIEEGDQAIRLEARADLNASAQNEAVVAVQSQAELTFQVADTADPIELGSETTYEIVVRNSGSRNDTNVQLRLQLPPGLELMQSDMEAQTDGRGGVLFAPQSQFAAGDEMIYRVRVRGIQADTHIIEAILTSDQSRVPVTKQESTMVYADR